METGREKIVVYRHSISACISTLFAALLVGSMLLALSSLTAASPAQPAQGGNPLPNNCSDITEPGEEPPVCCAFGYVYHDGVPAAGAQVVLQSASGVLTTTTSAGAASINPYYASALSDSPLNVVPGDMITLTVILRQAPRQAREGPQDGAHNDATATTVYQVNAGGQQVDVVIPVAEGDQPPIGTINYIYPNPAGQRSDMVAFAGSGADGDANGAGIVAWEWASDLDAGLSTQEDFQQAAYRLTTGTHTISFRVQDDEGNWSAPVVRTLEVEPMAFQLHPGWQVVVLPALPDAGYDAKRLLEDITDQAGCPAGLSRWMPGLSNWGSYLPELPFGNFGVEPWQPYFLRATCPSALRLPASFRTAPPGVIPLTTGWNFVALPRTAGGPTAEAVCEQIVAQGGAVSEIDRWDADVGDWAGHICGQPFGDFEMTPDEGYFIASQVDSVWRPTGDSMSAVRH